MINSLKNDTNNQPETREDKILQKLKDRVKQIGFGSLVCELQIHQGKISQIEITGIREKMRVD